MEAGVLILLRLIIEAFKALVVYIQKQEER